MPVTVGAVGRLTGVRMSVEMPEPILVLVQVEVNPLFREPAEDVDPENHQHQPDGELQSRCEPLGKRTVHEQHRGAEEEEGERMTEAPEDALPYALPRARAPRRETRNRGDMVGLESMPHADEETKDQKTDHLIRISPLVADERIPRKGM